MSPSPSLPVSLASRALVAVAVGVVIVVADGERWWWQGPR